MVHVPRTGVRAVRRSSVAGTALVVLAGALGVEALDARGTESSSAEAALAASSAADRVRPPGADAIADALGNADLVAPSLAAEVTAIDATGSGWLLLIGSATLVPDDARALCKTLAEADALPPAPVFVTDADRQLVQGC